MNKFKKVFDPKWWFYDFVKWSGYPGIGLYYRIKKIYIDGKKPKNLFKGRLIICSNHVSYEDAAAIITGLWERRISFLATKELFNKKGFGGFFRRVGCISVDKSNFDISSIRQAINVIKKGHSVCVFPEGHISENGELQPFKSGIVMTAYLANADILPIYINKRKNILQRSVIVIGKRIKIKDLIKTPAPTIDEINNIADLLNKKEIELKEAYEKRWLNKNKKGKK